MENEQQVEALAKLPADVVIMRLENETIQALAAAHPRNHEKIREELAKQIEAYPSFVRSAIYCKPVGKDPDTGQKKFVRGLSIKAAEAIAEAYGFCRIRSDVTPIDDATVKIEATFTDYQKGRIWQDGGIVSKFYKDRYGKMQRIPDDRFYNVTVKAEASKRIREVILRSVPPGLRSELTDMVEKQIDLLLDDSTVQKIITNFAAKNIPLEELEKRVGRPLKAGWTQEDRKNLLGLWNSLEQEETTVAEILDDEGEPNKNGSTEVAGPVSSADFNKSSKAPEEGKTAQTPEQDKKTKAKVAAEKEKLGVTMAGAGAGGKGKKSNLF